MTNIKLVAYGVDTLILNIRYADSNGQPIKQGDSVSFAKLRRCVCADLLEPGK